MFLKRQQKHSFKARENEEQLEEQQRRESVAQAMAAKRQNEILEEKQQRRLSDTQAKEATYHVYTSTLSYAHALLHNGTHYCMVVCGRDTL